MMMLPTVTVVMLLTVTVVMLPTVTVVMLPTVTVVMLLTVTVVMHYVCPPGSHSQKSVFTTFSKSQEKNMWVLLADILKSQCLPHSQNSMPWYIDRRKALCRVVNSMESSRQYCWEEKKRNALWRVVDSTVGKKKRNALWRVVDSTVGNQNCDKML